MADVAAGAGAGASAGGDAGAVVRAADGAGSSLIALLVLNLLDGVFTLAFLQAGVAEEANPIMRAAYEKSPLFFMGAKLSLVHAGAAMLWFSRTASAARTAMAAGVLLYAAIVAYHCSFLLSLLVG